ncbi:hypothetical protein ADM96_39200 [Burkholderia sp. ST111]|nr:hypothetical protein ADM96_39200 [Burkholderia sp. ST111]
MVRRARLIAKQAGRKNSQVVIDMTARTEKGTGLQNRAREMAGASGASMLRDFARFAFPSIFPDCSESAHSADSVRPLNSPS